MKYQIWLFIALLVVGNSYLSAQSLDRFVIGSTGGEAIGTTVHLEYTVGEVATQTLDNGTFVLNQGFHQTNPPFNTSIERTQIRVDYSLYPNPTHDIVNLKLELERPTDIVVELLDIRGRRSNIPAQSWSNQQQIQAQFDLSTLPTGLYLMTIRGKSGEVAQSLRIEKLN
ncbi:MAG: T9SS type A sorting domain-containing protein [Bacteroidota bacterium]